MPITRTNMIDDDGSGTTGTIINNAWKQELYGQIDAETAIHIGQWIPIAYNATYFSSSTGVWTVAPADMGNLEFCVLGNAIIVQWTVTGVISADSVFLFITVPGMPASLRTVATAYTFYIGPQAIYGAGNVSITAGQQHFGMIRDIGGTPWPAGSTIITQGQMIFPFR